MAPVLAPRLTTPMQWCSKKHVKSGTLLQLLITDSRCRGRWGAATGNFRLSAVRRPIRTCIPDKAPEKAPADLLGVSFPEAQERREVGWIGVREEREGEEEKEGKRRMGDGLILGGGENEGGGCFFIQRKTGLLPAPPPLPPVEGNGRRKPCPPPTSSEGPASQSPGPRPSNKSTIGKETGSELGPPTFFFLLFFAPAGLSGPDSPSCPRPCRPRPQPSVSFPLCCPTRRHFGFDAAQSSVFFFANGRPPRVSGCQISSFLHRTYVVRQYTVATGSCQQHKDGTAGSKETDRLSDPRRPGFPGCVVDATKLIEVRRVC